MIKGYSAWEYLQSLDRFIPFLNGFAERSQDRVSARELHRRIVENDAQVWVAGDFKAVCLTHVGNSHVGIDCCAGEDREEWQDDLEAEIAAWALFLGKKRVILSGRPGWSKWARTKGYMPAHVEMVKELSDGR